MAPTTNIEPITPLMFHPEIKVQLFIAWKKLETRRHCQFTNELPAVLRSTNEKNM